MSPNTIPLKSFTIEAQTGPFGSQLHAHEYIEKGIPVINPSNIKDGRLIPDEKATVSMETSRRLDVHRLQRGDIVFARRGDLGRGAVAKKEAEGWLCGTGCIRVRPNQDLLDPHFISYALQSIEVRSYFEKWAVGSTMGNLNTTIVLGLPIPNHPPEEQRRIANFLDAQITHIDKLDAVLREQVSLLEMRRQAQITEAVSGQTSRGKPRALRAVAEVILGRQRAPQHADGPHMVPYLRAANVKDGVLDLTDVLSMNFTLDEQQIFALRPGDILVTEGSGSINAVGASAVWGGEIPGVVCFQNTLLRIRPRKGLADGKFLEWWARSAFAAGEFASIATGANIYHLSAERVRTLPTRFPSLDDQRKIADRLTGETQNIDHFIELRERQLNLLSERRQALITAAVAGRFDVTTASSSFTT
ncbi:restriction endonuclease subunit S [Actinoallomurus iriomotensis]|uniref:Type I restriction modification DNA specificity domain-containing protein n=1 Tax=Actinoallomurus iriomotensis TaxID=478107 RepID=A0A9W6RS32_9ACTN|nr:restriction endonuclease subunit S [Actinoallomurus iriomotensis]GLY80580.1 hypothetical protein Airi01_088470 [Actinoallomurus iriomotensis]